MDQLTSRLVPQCSTVSAPISWAIAHTHKQSPNPCSTSAHLSQAASPDVDSTARHTQTDITHAAAAAAAAGSSQGSAAAAASEQRWRAAMSVAPAKSGEAGGVWGRSPHLGVGWKCVSDASAVTEVHLRRLDVGSDLHRRVVAVLTVDATPQEVRRNKQAKRLGFKEKVVSGKCVG